MVWRSWWLSIVAVGMAGPALADRGEAPIRGGTDDTTDVAVVGIVDDTGGATCTGALIAPDLVLTAQHCLAPVIQPGPCATMSFGAPVAASRFYVTTRATLTANPNDYRRATELRLPPGQGFCGRDIALLRLGTRVAPAEAMPIAPRLEPPLAAAEPYAAVGYGATDDNNTGAGQRRRRDGLAVQCVADGCAANGFMDIAEWQGETGVCQGDSGGPALDGAGKVVGVASRGAVGCQLPVYGHVAAHRDWLVAEAERAAAMGGYPVPAWAGGGPIIDAAVDAPPSIDAGLDAGMDPIDDDGGCCSSGTARASLVAALPLLALLRRRRSPR